MPSYAPLPAAGSLAPDFRVRSGRDVDLQLSALRGAPVVLVFLRHLGCPICRLELATLQRRHAEVAALGARVIVFVDSPDPSVRAYATRQDVPFELVADPHGEIYRRYGVTRGGAGAILAPAALARSVGAVAQGFMHGKFEGSERQLPADFVVGSDGRLTFARLGKHIGDNTPLDTLLAAIRTSRPAATQG